MVTPILTGNPARIASSTTTGTPASSAQQVPAGLAMPAPAVRHFKRSRFLKPDLEQALTLLASLLEVVDEAGRDRVAQRLQLLTRAPDSRIALDALRVELFRVNPLRLVPRVAT